jgi:glycosyltransferase involved in cell wall biosynthesis
MQPLRPALSGVDMRIILAVDAPSAHLFPLPNGWADRGHTVDVLMDRPDGRFGHASEFVHPGVRLSVLSREGSLLDAVTGGSTSTRLTDVLGSAGAIVIGGYATRVARRIVHSRSIPAARVVLLAERPLPRPAGPRRWTRDAWARWFVSRVDAIWSMSAAGDRAFARLGSVPEAHIPYPMVLPPHAPDFAVTQNRKWDGAAPLRLLVLGQLIERKRPIAAIEAVRILRHRGMNLHAAVAGTGHLEGEVANAAKGLPITLHGRVPASTVGALIARSHVLLHPASHDGWGMAVVEAASRGVPVVATTGCDAATELAAMTSGVRITDGSPPAMARAAQELIEEFRADPVGRSLDLIRAVEEVCGVDRVVERSLDALTAAGADGG